MNEVLAVNAALLLVEKLLPLIEAQVKAGQITPEDQALLRGRYESLKAKGDAAFAAPHWQVNP